MKKVEIILKCVFILDKKNVLFLFFMVFFSSMQAQDRFVQRWQIGMQGGAGYMLANTKKMEEDLLRSMANKTTAGDFCKNLSRGSNYGADIHYMFNHWGGIGVKYSGFYSSASIYRIFDPFGDGSLVFTNMEKRLYINFFGLSFRTQQYITSSNKFRLIMDIAFGYAHYRDEEEYDYYWLSNYLLKSNNIGAKSEIGVEYFPLRWMSIGVSASCFLAWFQKGTVTDGNNSVTVKFKDHLLENINASRLDLSIGIKIFL